MHPASVALPCPSCGTEVSPGLLACPRCNRLVHGAQLSALAEQASAAEQSGDLSQALGCWRAALDLLPPAANQFAAIRAQIERRVALNSRCRRVVW